MRKEQYIEFVVGSGIISADTFAMQAFIESKDFIENYANIMA